MPRLASLLLAALVATAADGAPVPRPKASPVWTRGWDRPVNPGGRCRFDRTGDKLTLTVPGRGHGLDVSNGRLNAPRLLRDLRGDFVVQVRVGGDFRPKRLAGGLRRAG